MEIQKPADLARVIKNERLHRELTQQDLAEAVGVTRQSIARIERGSASASFDTILRIFSRLGLKLSTRPQRAQTQTVSTKVFPALPVIKVAPAAARPGSNFPRVDTSALISSLPKIDTSTLITNFSHINAAHELVMSTALREITSQIRPISELITEYGNTSDAWKANRNAFAAATKAYQAVAEAAGSALSGKEAQVAIHRALSIKTQESAPEDD